MRGEVETRVLGMSRMFALVLLVALASACNGSTPTKPGPPAPTEVATVPPGLAGSIPPGAPVEDIRDFKEWPSPNNGLYNTRVASSTISTTNVANLAVAWSLPLTGTGASGPHFSIPLIANVVVYLQDSAS